MLTFFKKTALVIILGFSLSACDKQAVDEKLTPPESSNATVEVLKVGTMGTYNPFSYVDEKGIVTGYDLEVLREIAKRDPSLKFEFIASPWDTLFPGLDAGKFQLLANQITATPERQARYHLTDNKYSIAESRFIISSSRSDIKTLQDLKGKKVGLTTGDAHSLHADQWNTENNKLFEIVYYESDLPSILQDIENGRIDATLNSPIVAEDKAKTQGLKVTSIGERIVATPTYFIFRKDAKGLELKSRIDAVLKTMTDDGSLSSLSMKWFNQDISK